MAKQQPAPAKLPAPAPVDDPAGAEDETSAKLYKPDTQKLKQLASLINMKMADAYRLVCGPVVDAALIAAARRRAAEVESESRGRG